MKKIISMILSCMMLMTSCFSTRLVSEEPQLKRNYKGATVENIEFEFGRPDNVSRMERGYVYTYNYSGKGLYNGKRTESPYIDFLFNENDEVTNVKSTTAVHKKQFDGGATAFTIVFFTVILPTLIIVVAASK